MADRSPISLRKGSTMRQLKNTSKPNLTIHRMFGGATEQFDNLLQTLKWLEASKPTPAETYFMA